MKIYDMEQWEKDGSFGADPGQEITEKIYNEMLNCLPPKGLPRHKARQVMRDYGIPIHAGFMMGEPHSTGRRGEDYYLSFGTDGKKYYFLGLATTAPVLDGTYYYLDCMNAFANDGLFPESEFKDVQDAIQTAVNYEATLYRYEYRNGERIDSAVLYDPWER